MSGYLSCAPNGDLAYNPGMCSAGNLTSHPLVHKRTLNPLTTPARALLMILILIIVILFLWVFLLLSFH